MAKYRWHTLPVQGPGDRKNLREYKENVPMGRSGDPLGPSEDQPGTQELKNRPKVPEIDDSGLENRARGGL